MLLFHFHTLHANALWKVPSRIPPRRREGGRGRAGMEGSSLTGSASPRGVASTCLPLPAGSGPSGGGLGPSPWRTMRAEAGPGLRAPGSSEREALALLQPPPRKFWSGARSRASCLYSPQPRGEIPRDLSAAQRACRLFKYVHVEFRSKPQFNVNHK